MPLLDPPLPDDEETSPDEELVLPDDEETSPDEELVLPDDEETTPDEELVLPEDEELVLLPLLDELLELTSPPPLLLELASTVDSVAGGSASGVDSEHAKAANSEPDKTRIGIRACFMRRLLGGKATRMWCTNGSENDEPP